MLGICVLLGLLVIYLFLVPARLRKYAWFNILFALIALFFISTYQKFSGDTYKQMGLDFSNMEVACKPWLIITPIAFAIMFLIGLWRKTIVWSINILICFAPYYLWGGIQQYIVQGFVGVRLTELGLPMLLIAAITALLFACLHLFDKRLFPLTFVLGFFFSIAFQANPNIFPLAFTHGLLGVAYYYFIAGEDAWMTKLVKPLRNLIARKTLSSY